MAKVDGEERLQEGVCVVSRKLLYLMFALLVSVIVALPQVADARGGGGRGGGGGHGGGGHGFGGGGHGFGGHGFGGFHGFGGHRIAFRGFGGRHFFGHRRVHVVGFHRVHRFRGYRHGYYPYYHHRNCWRWVVTRHGLRHVNVCYRWHRWY